MGGAGAGVGGGGGALLGCEKHMLLLHCLLKGLAALVLQELDDFLVP